MLFLIFFNTIIIILYSGVFISFIYGFRIAKELNNKQNPLPISVIIPVRNEAKNIKKLIESFTVLNYNLNITEFLFIDDNSNDGSYENIIKELKKTNLIYKIIKQPIAKQGKKQAIITGVSNAKNNWIVTTDADSTPDKNWLNQFSNAFQKNNNFIIAPVINHSSISFIGKLQNIEALLLAGTTIGSASNNTPLICSGANLGYTKALFEELKPYEDNLHLSSGDDLFFLDKMLIADKKVAYLKSKEAVVTTKGPSTYNELLSQAVRWSSKNKLLKTKLNFYLAIIVFFTNCLVLINLSTLYTYPQNSIVFLSIKFSIDLLFLVSVARYYNQKLIWLAPFIFLLYPIHLLIIFVASFFLSVKWKERAIIKHGKQ